MASDEAGGPPENNPVSAQVATVLNLGPLCHLALRCGTETLWLAAPAHEVRHRRLQPGSPLTVELQSESLICWREVDGIPR